MFPYKKIKAFCKKVGYNIHDFKDQFCVDARKFEDPEELLEYDGNDGDEEVPYYDMIRQVSKENPMYRLIYRWHEDVGNLSGARVDFRWVFWFLSDGRVTARCIEECDEWKSPVWETFMSLDGEITVAPKED